MVYQKFFFQIKIYKTLKIKESPWNKDFFNIIMIRIKYVPLHKI